jgi:hypothetical protein
VIDMNGDGTSGVRRRGLALRQLDDGLRHAEVLFACSRALPTSYCTSKTNSLGCTPSMVWNGTASLSSSAAFTCSCFNAINQTSGLFFYAQHAERDVVPGRHDVRRHSSAANAAPQRGWERDRADCTACSRSDFKTYLQSGVDPTLVAGSEVFLQCWARDPASPSTTSLSNAVRFLVNP